MQCIKISTIQKRRGPRADDRAIFEDLRPRGQGQEFDFQGQGQGLENVSSRTPPLLFSTLYSLVGK